MQGIPDDFKIIKSNKEEFFVESKINNAQSSQFVVKIENKSFIYSQKNYYPGNIFCDQIVEKLNENFDA